jgi:hypothetical protein
MKKYLLISTIAWSVLSLFALIIAVYEIKTAGIEKGWVYLIAFGLAVFLTLRRYVGFRKAGEAKK